MNIAQILADIIVSAVHLIVSNYAYKRMYSRFIKTLYPTLSRFSIARKCAP